MTYKNGVSLEELAQRDSRNSKSGHGILDLPIMLSGIIVGMTCSAMGGFKLAHGDPIPLDKIAIGEGVGLVLTTISGSGFCSKNLELLYAPAVYTGLQVVAGAAGYLLGRF
jgi:hypothetical protein